MDAPLHLDMYADVAQLAEDVRSMRQRMAEIRATAESADGLISATVGGSGELIELWLDPRIYRLPDSAALARDIADTIHRAAQLSQEEGFALAAGYLPPGATPDTADLRFGPMLRELDRQAAGGER